MTIEIKDDVVTMTAAEYEELQNDAQFLNCLRAAGVDNWDGYEYAQEAYADYLNQE